MNATKVSKRSCFLKRKRVGVTITKFITAQNLVIFIRAFNRMCCPVFIAPVDSCTFFYFQFSRNKLKVFNHDRCSFTAATHAFCIALLFSNRLIHHWFRRWSCATSSKKQRENNKDNQYFHHKKESIVLFKGFGNRENRRYKKKKKKFPIAKGAGYF